MEELNSENKAPVVLGKITGKTTTNKFDFIVSSSTNKFEFVQVLHRNYGYVLCQVLELIKDSEKTIARCDVIGYRDENSRVQSIKVPFDIGVEVLRAEDNFIRKIIDMTEKNGAYIGNLDGKNIPIRLNLNKLLTRHVSVLAKSGSGKSYFVGVLLEEIMKKRVPLVIIDPHGEYQTLKYPNTSDKEKLGKFGMEPQGFFDSINLYDQDNLKLSENLSAQELMHILPKLNTNQQALLYSAMNDVDNLDFNSLILSLQNEESPAKWSLISTLEYYKKIGLFSMAPTKMQELVKPATCSIINLKGVDPELQELIVYKVVKELFEERKKERLPPFFLVMEEAHNYIPERSFGETKCSKIIRTVASEGRKFGLGLCVISQRPARVDKNVLSQCTTQVILKMTNPNDLKAVSNSVEGITAETEQEMQNLSIGTGLVTGLVDMPLLVNIRPRQTQHGGEEVNMLDSGEVKGDVVDEISSFESKELMPVIMPNISKSDLKMMHDDVKDIKTHLVPCLQIELKNPKQNLLVELTKGYVVCDLDKSIFSQMPDLKSLSESERKIVRFAAEKGSFNAADLMSFDVSFIRANNILQSLTDKGVLVKEGVSYNLAKEYNLGEKQSYYVPEFKAVEYDNIIQPNVVKENVLENIGKLCEVSQSKDCYIVHYEVLK